MILHPRIRIREARTFANEARVLAQARHLEATPLRDLRIRQGRMLHRAVEYAYRNIPFYREAFRRRGIGPRQIRGLDDLGLLPITTKEEVLANYPSRMVAPSFLDGSNVSGRAFRSASSGTSGLRGNYLTDWSTRDANFALLYRARHLFGFRPADLECRLAWRPRNTRRWYNILGLRGPFGISILNTPQENVRVLMQMRPECVYGSPSCLYAVSQNLPRSGDALRPKLVISTGEVLEARVREIIARAFQAPVDDLYGAAEQNYLASQCPEMGGLHTNMLNAILEVSVDGEPAAPGERGEILVTQLTNRAMPLIRYRIGDVGRMKDGECGCGRHGDVLEEVEGRKDDFLRKRNGEEIPGEVLRTIVTLPGIAGYRVIQETLSRIVIQLVAEQRSLAANKAQIALEIRRVMADPLIDVEFQEVDRIDADPSGKRRLVYSKLTSA